LIIRTLALLSGQYQSYSCQNRINLLKSVSDFRICIIFTAVSKAAFYKKASHKYNFL